LIKEYGKENVLTTLKSIIDFYEKNTWQKQKSVV
jgi:hypothetical protein